MAGLRPSVLLALALFALGATIASANASLFVGDSDTHAILQFSTSGEFVGEFVKRRSGGLRSPRGFDFWEGAGKTDTTVLFVASFGTGKVLKFDGSNGRFLSVVQNVDSPLDLVVHEGVLYVSSAREASVLRFRAATGSPLGMLARGPPIAGPAGLALRTQKNTVELLVANSHSGKILALAPETAWACPLTKSACGKPAYVVNSKSLTPVTDLALGGGSLYSVGPRSGAIYRLNATTGEYIEHFEPPAIGSSFMGVAYMRGHLFVSTKGAVLRFNAQTGEFYGEFAIYPNVLSQP